MEVPTLLDPHPTLTRPSPSFFEGRNVLQSTVRIIMEELGEIYVICLVILCFRRTMLLLSDMSGRSALSELSFSRSYLHRGTPSHLCCQETRNHREGTPGTTAASNLQVLVEDYYR